MAEITELYEAELLGSLILINVVPRINVVAEITELRVENSQNINCLDITSIREVRVNKKGYDHCCILKIL